MAGKHVSHYVSMLVGEMSGASREEVRGVGGIGFQVVIVVEKSEKTLGEKVRSEMLELLGQVGILLLDTCDLTDKVVVKSLEEALKKGVLLLPIFSWKLCNCGESMNVLYGTFMKEFKRRKNGNFFIPIWMDNPRHARYIPVLFCNFKGLQWKRIKEREKMTEIFRHHFGNIGKKGAIMTKLEGDKEREKGKKKFKKQSGKGGSTM